MFCDPPDDADRPLEALDPGLDPGLEEGDADPERDPGAGRDPDGDPDPGRAAEGDRDPEPERGADGDRDPDAGCFPDGERDPERGCDPDPGRDPDPGLAPEGDRDPEPPSVGRRRRGRLRRPRPSLLRLFRFALKTSPLMSSTRKTPMPLARMEPPMNISQGLSEDMVGASCSSPAGERSSRLLPGASCASMVCSWVWWAERAGFWG